MNTAQVIEKVGAGERNRTVVISLEGCCSTIELHPRNCRIGRRTFAPLRGRPGLEDRPDVLQQMVGPAIAAGPAVQAH